MTPYQKHTLLLTAGIFAVLIVASVVGWALKLRLAPDRPHAAIDNLNARVKAWWLMAAVLSLALLAGKTGVIVLFALASFIALREYATIAPTRRGDHVGLLLAFFVIIPFQYFLIAMDWYGLYSIFIPVYGFLILPTLAAVRGEVPNFMQRTATLQWGLMICVFCISHVPALLTLAVPGYEGRNAFLLVFLILVVQSSDVLQYVWGKLFGRTKIAPEVSPSKTVAGFVGGVASTTVLGAALWWITPVTPLQAALISLAIALMGFLGGLVMSAIKRDRGVKDYGGLLPGHGGVLDRIDSLLFAAPIFFHATRFFF
jgi:phosphatidate cytidylyltransferase